MNFFIIIWCLAQNIAFSPSSMKLFCKHTWIRRVTSPSSWVFFVWSLLIKLNTCTFFNLLVLNIKRSILNYRLKPKYLNRRNGIKIELTSPSEWKNTNFYITHVFHLKNKPCCILYGLKPSFQLQTEYASTQYCWSS